MRIGSTVRTHLGTGLGRLRAAAHGSVIHFCMVRIGGESAPPRAVFGLRGTEANLARFKAVWGKEEGVAGTLESTWLPIRGAVRVEHVDQKPEFTTCASLSGSRVTDPVRVQKAFKDLRILLRRVSLPTDGVDNVLGGSFTPPRNTDTPGFADPKAPALDDEEAEPVAEPPSFADEGPKSDHAGIRALQERLAGVDMGTLLGLGAKVASDEVPRVDAVAQIDLGCRTLLAILHDGETLRATRPARREPARTPAQNRELAELLARARAAARDLEEVGLDLTVPDPEIALAQGRDAQAPALLKDAEDAYDNAVQRGVKEPKLSEYRDKADKAATARPWLRELGEALEPAERHLRDLAREARQLELADMLQGGNLAARTRAERVLTEAKAAWQLLDRCTARLEGATDRKYDPLRPLIDPSKASGRRIADALGAALGRIRALGVQRSSEDRSKSGRTRLRALLEEEMATEPAALDEFLKLPEGEATLDAIIRDLGGAAKAGTELEFVKKALESRFKLKLTGDWTRKATPRLYELLAIRPAEHTRDNPKLGTVRRTKRSDAFEGSYRANVLELKTPRSGIGAKNSPWKLGSDGARGKVVAFDHIALHELGHAVDDNIPFMSNHMQDDAYGGWKDEEDVDVARALCADFIADNGVAGLDPAERLAFATAAVNGKSSYAARNWREGYDKAKGAPLADDAWEKLWEHQGLAKLLQLLKWGDGVCFKGEEGAEMGKVGLRVFCHYSRWRSYTFACRTRKMSDYQFRSPAEWFAEIYAAYCLDRMESSHPDYGWISGV